jgi:hypothetical protein
VTIMGWWRKRSGLSGVTNRSMQTASCSVADMRLKRR